MSEFFDIVGQEGNPTGEIIERNIAHANGIWHRTSHVWLVRYSAIAKFRANGKLYHLFQYGNATLKDKGTGKEINFTMIRLFSGRVKFEQGTGFFGKLLSKIFG